MGRVCFSIAFNGKSIFFYEKMVGLNVVSFNRVFVDSWMFFLENKHSQGRIVNGRADRSPNDELMDDVCVYLRFFLSENTFPFLRTISLFEEVPGAWLERAEERERAQGCWRLFLVGDGAIKPNRRCLFNKSHGRRSICSRWSLTVVGYNDIGVGFNKSKR